ncbi:MAG: glycosyltransferase family 2 protein [Flavobacteriaceae bacterium]|nr:glycosyltransferase family 2 protein [Flavobacteriaceae bacterium]
MKVSGFTFIRNSIKYDYPIVEAIQSVLPLVDEFVLALGKSDDGTGDMIRQKVQSDKLRILDTVWDESLRQGGRVLAVETDKALAALNAESTWCIYLQGDECLHEKDHQNIQAAMQKWKDNKEVEALWFDWLHFCGTYDYVADSFSRYRREVRIIRNGLGISSWKDAQGFRKNGEKLRAKPANAQVYHYGMVKPPNLQQDRLKYFHSLWHDEHKVKEMVGSEAEFDYNSLDKLYRFAGSHPQYIQERISRLNWQLTNDPTQNPVKLKIKLKMLTEKLFGIRLGEYKGFIGI